MISYRARRYEPSLQVALKWSERVEGEEARAAVLEAPVAPAAARVPQWSLSCNRTTLKELCDSLVSHLRP
eukprot:8877997-Pyramimonas_sp.AAC.1